MPERPNKICTMIHKSGLVLCVSSKMILKNDGEDENFCAAQLKLILAAKEKGNGSFRLVNDGKEQPKLWVHQGFR